VPTASNQFIDRLAFDFPWKFPDWSILKQFPGGKDLLRKVLSISQMKLASPIFDKTRGHQAFYVLTE